METPIKKWLGSKPKACELCFCDLSTQRYFVDANIRYRGRLTWALVCPACHKHYGVGIGTGLGQKYDSQPPYIKLEG